MCQNMFEFLVILEFQACRIKLSQKFLEQTINEWILLIEFGFLKDSWRVRGIEQIELDVFEFGSTARLELDQIISPRLWFKRFGFVEDGFNEIVTRLLFKHFAELVFGLAKIGEWSSLTLAFVPDAAPASEQNTHLSLVEGSPFVWTGTIFFFRLENNV